MKRATVGIATCAALAVVLLVGPALAQDEVEPASEDAPAAEPADPAATPPVEEEEAGAAEAPAAPAAPAGEAESAAPGGGAAAPVPPVEEDANEAAEAELAGEETGTAVAGEATLEAEVEPAKPAIWRNSIFVYENFVSAYSFDRNAELTYNPYYGMSYTFIPRIYLYKGMSLRLRWSLEQELTNSDTTTKKHEIFWSDVYLDWVWGGAAVIPGIDVAFTPKVRFTLPASKTSQARTLYMAIGPGFDFLKVFDVMGGITIQYAFRYTKYFNKYTGAVSEDPLVECPGSTKSCPFYALGPRNTSHSFTNSFYIDFSPTDKLHFALQVAIINRLLYKNTETDVDILGGSYEVQESSKNTNHSGLMQYVIEVAYDVAPFLSMSLGVNTYNPMLAPNSEYYPPFFNRYTNLYLDFIFYPEVLVTKLATGRKTELEKALH